MRDNTPLNLCHFGELFIGETLASGVRNGQIGEINFIFEMKLMVIEDAFFLHGLLELIIIEILVG